MATLPFFLCCKTSILGMAPEGVFVLTFPRFFNQFIDPKKASAKLKKGDQPE
jgi:hypothetical protein